MDEDTQNATRWEEHILHQLETAACVLVLWSDASRQSKWVTLEAARAIERKKLVHALLDDQPPPGDLAAYQANNLAKWDGKSSDLEFLRLLSAVANHIGTPGAVGTLQKPLEHEQITEKHLALTSSSWRRDGTNGQGPFPYQIHLMIVGSKEALDRVENVLYFFDPAYAESRPEFVDPVLKAYVMASSDRAKAFGVYELANGFSVVRAAVKVRNQAEIVNLSRLVDIVEKGPHLKELYLR